MNETSSGDSDIEFETRQLELDPGRPAKQRRPATPSVRRRGGAGLAAFAAAAIIALQILPRVAERFDSSPWALIWTATRPYAVGTGLPASGPSPVAHGWVWLDAVSAVVILLLLLIDIPLPAILWLVPIAGAALGAVPCGWQLLDALRDHADVRTVVCACYAVAAVLGFAAISQWRRSTGAANSPFSKAFWGLVLAAGAVVIAAYATVHNG